MQMSKPTSRPTALFATFLLALLSSLLALILSLTFGYNPRTPIKLPLLSNAVWYNIAKYQFAQYRLSIVITVGLCISILASFIGGVCCLILLRQGKRVKYPLYCTIGNSRILLYLCGVGGLLSSAVSGGLQMSILIQVIVPAYSTTLLCLAALSCILLTWVFFFIAVTLSVINGGNQEEIKQQKEVPAMKLTAFQPDYRAAMYKSPITSHYKNQQQIKVIDKQTNNIKNEKYNQDPVQVIDKQNQNLRQFRKPLMQNYLPYNILSEKQDQSLSYYSPINSNKLFPVVSHKLGPPEQEALTPRHEFINNQQKIAFVNAMPLSKLEISAILPQRPRGPPAVTQPTPIQLAAKKGSHASILGHLQQGKIPQQVGANKKNRPDLRRLRSDLLYT